MKHYFLVLSILLSTLVSFTAMADLTHIVDRGETLGDIAKKYGVSENDIIRLNPDAAQFVYVGMELVIPGKENSGDTSVVKSSPADKKTSSYETEATSESFGNYASNATSNNQNKPSNQQQKEDQGWYWGIEGGYNASNIIGGDIKTSMLSGGHAGIAFGYKFPKLLLLDSGLYYIMKGYKQRQTDDSRYATIDLKTTMTTHCIELPLNVGIHSSGWYIKAGPFFDYYVAGTQHTQGTIKYYEDIHTVLTEYRDDKKGIGDLNGYNRFDVGIGVGVGMQTRNFLLGFSYQYGFVPVIEDSEYHQENIMVTLGVFF